MTAISRVFSIPPSQPFLNRLVEALLDGTLVPGFPDKNDPLALARATIFLPTRRACRVLTDIFRDDYPHLVLLPRIRPLGALDESDFLFTEKDDIGFDAAGLPPAISPLERQMILTRLVLRWASQMEESGDPALTPASPADAAFLAGELARLLDMLSYEGVPVEALHALPPLDLQQHWQKAFEFLQIISAHWPAYLADNNQMEPAQRRRQLMQAESARLAALPEGPVIAAGSTGSVPITAEFLEAVARHPCGAVVLPGLDLDADEDIWQLAGMTPGHPQAAMAALLQRLKLARGDVRVISNSLSSVREKILSEAMRPAETTDKWAEQVLDNQHLQDALQGVSLVEAANEPEEALAIALLMRETLEQEGATAALVTPDRLLARRVASELKRFSLYVDDSAGTPLPATRAGIFARLVADAAMKKGDGVSCLSLLKHPLCPLGQTPEEADIANGTLERLLYRGVAAPENSAQLLENFSKNSETQASRGVTVAQRELAQERLARLCLAIAPLEKCLANQNVQPLSVFIEVHLNALVAFASQQENDGAANLAASQDGEELLAFFEALQKASPQQLHIAGVDYPQLWNAFANQQSVRPVRSEEPRLRIYGLLEARLMRHDRLILAGLNEGTWPQTANTDPWLSRGMLQALSLPVPERRIALAAHDFVQALGSPDVWLTRALKGGGSPTVPSRFVQRLEAVVGPEAFSGVRHRGEAMLTLARYVSAPRGNTSGQPVARPLADPPIEARPRQLSVTRMEALVRDPYAIYAEKILGLKPFEPVGQDIGARQRGTLIHGILSDFATQLNNGAAPNAELLQAIARQHFAPYMNDTEIAHLWWPRFVTLVPDILAFEQERRAQAKTILVETHGTLQFDLPAGTFTLTACADRIEKKDREFAIVDFKTGRPPERKNIRASFALQLPLEAAMLEAGAFKNAQGKSDELFYIGLNGLRETKERFIDEDDVMAFARMTLQEAKKVLARFDAGEPYRSCADSSYATQSGDYLHLARLNEWGLADSEEAEQ